MNLSYMSKLMMKELGRMEQTGGSNGSMAFFNYFLVSLIFFLIKTSLVYWSYNEIMPKILTDKFRPITFNEAIVLVILVQALFR